MSTDEITRLAEVAIRPDGQNQKIFVIHGLEYQREACEPDDGLLHPSTSQRIRCAVLSLDRFCTMQTTRGCPFKCIYCDIPSLSRGKWRNRSPEHVLGEMQQLNDEGYRSIYLTDDHFLMQRTRIESICNGIIDKKL